MKNVAKIIELLGGLVALESKPIRIEPPCSGLMRLCIEHVGMGPRGMPLISVAHYFEQAGALMFLAHLLGARDLHMENLVASRAGPTLVDLELLLQPSPRSTGALTSGTTDEDLTRIGESVLRTGLLLPQS